MIVAFPAAFGRAGPVPGSVGTLVGRDFVEPGMVGGVDRIISSRLDEVSPYRIAPLVAGEKFCRNLFVAPLVIATERPLEALDRCGPKEDRDSADQINSDDDKASPDFLTEFDRFHHRLTHSFWVHLGGSPARVNASRKAATGTPPLNFTVMRWCPRPERPRSRWSRSERVPSRRKCHCRWLH